MRGSSGWHWKRLILSLMVTLAVSALVSWGVARWTAPWRARQALLRQLTGPDPAARHRALLYLVAHAGTSPALAHAVIERLGSVRDSALFLKIGSALDQAGLWDRAHIPTSLWLRQIAIRASEGDRYIRAQAVQQCLTLRPLADDPRLQAILQKACADKNIDVRSNALFTAAELRGAAHNPDPYTRLIEFASHDRRPEIAAHAWIFLGLINPASGTPGNWRQAPVPVADAMLWAALHTNPDKPQPALDALTKPDVPPAVRAFAVYLMHLADPHTATAALTPLLAINPEHITSDNQLMVWRAILATPAAAATGQGPGPSRSRPHPREGQPQSEPSSPSSLSSTDRPTDIPTSHPLPLAPALLPLINAYRLAPSSLAGVEPLILAATYRTGVPPRAMNRAPKELRRLEALAAIEGGWQGYPIVRDSPEMLRLAAVAGAPHPHPQDLYPLFSSDNSAMRDLACFVAARRFDSQQNAILAHRGLIAFNDDAKMTGAMLAGLAGVERTFLAKRTAVEDQAPVRAIMQLGLWMQGQPVPGAGNEPIPMAQWVPGLLIRPDVPRTTVLLALLQMHQRAGLDYILAPQTTLPKIDLLQLLGDQRWWRIVRRYLPAEAPPFWPWADPEIQAFQIDVLRDWYVLNRDRMFR